MHFPLMNGTFASAALLVGVLRTLLNVPMFSHSWAVLSKQFQTTGPLNNRLSLPNFKFYLGTSINFPLRLESAFFHVETASFARVLP